MAAQELSEPVPYVFSLERFSLRDGLAGIVADLHKIGICASFATPSRGLYRVEYQGAEDRVSWRCAFSFYSMDCLFETYFNDQRLIEDDPTWPLWIDTDNPVVPQCRGESLDVPSTGSKWSLCFGLIEALSRLELACLRQARDERNPDRATALNAMARRLFLTCTSVQSDARPRAA